MRIAFVEIQNFRKLKSVRIDLSSETTLLVGANNSGKTSAMLALREFLLGRRGFTTNDFTLSNWASINEIGIAWGTAEGQATTRWDALLPSLDLWLEVSLTEIHYVRSLLPTLSWQPGSLGVRLRLEPKSIPELQRDFLTALHAANNVRAAAGDPRKPTVWPTELKSFLDRKLRDHFIVRYYSLDPTKCQSPEDGIARPQALPEGSEPIEGDPLAGLLQVDEISAQRGFTDSTAGKWDVEESRERRLLSAQLRTYYAKHLDASEAPIAADLDALRAIEAAHEIFDERLTSSFSSSLEELSTLNYPGITDARLRIATKVGPTDGLNHSASVQYDVLPAEESGANLRLPEDYNGLGYQNLISMVFRLMSFRDHWMRVGKAGAAPSEAPTPPIHLVLIEEPEAHLHVQVQQVFLRKARDVLRNHPDLRSSAQLCTQMVVSTHSSHVAHEMEFRSVRYFRRMRRDGVGGVPVSGVVNLSEVFGPDDETAKFVSRYLRAMHCELFFADAAILVEGQAERMLIPHFIRRDYQRLHSAYVSLLEIGGSHAHRLRALIEHLGLTTLVVTDVDSCEEVAGKLKAAAPRRGTGQKSRNATLKTWHPEKEALDDLLNLNEAGKVKEFAPNGWSLRVAYQVPVPVEIEAGNPEEALCTTFEDSLILENAALFRTMDGTGLVGAARRALADATSVVELSAKLLAEVKDADKGSFALDVLWHDRLTSELKLPRYIKDGLAWLQDSVRQQETSLGVSVAAPSGAVASAIDRATVQEDTDPPVPIVEALPLQPAVPEIHPTVATAAEDSPVPATASALAGVPAMASPPAASTTSPPVADSGSPSSAAEPATDPAKPSQMAMPWLKATS